MKHMNIIHDSNSDKVMRTGTFWNVALRLVKMRTLRIFPMIPRKKIGHPMIMDKYRLALCK
jgi:hypothetical protein